MDEIGIFEPRRVVLLLNHLLPTYSGKRARALLLRAAGVRIGRGSVVGGAVTLHGPRASRLQIGHQCWINVGCTFDVTDEVVIGDGVSLGHEVLVLTNTHEVGAAECRAGTLRSAPVTVSAGAWVGARATILPGVTIGEGAIVAAGSVVIADVAPNTLVAGVPATPRKRIGR